MQSNVVCEVTTEKHSSFWLVISFLLLLTSPLFFFFGSRKKIGKEKRGVVDSTITYMPAFVLLCTVFMIQTCFFACGTRSLLTRELVYGSMQGIATLLARRTSSSLSTLAFGLMLIGVVHVLRLPASGPMCIVFRLLLLMVVWVLPFWFLRLCFVCVSFRQLALYVSKYFI